MERLTIRQLCEGSRAALLSAKALLDDARLLQAHGRSTRAFALAYAAGEELGKIQLLMGAAVRLRLGMNVNWKRLRKDYRSHDYKARTLTYSDLYRMVAEREGRQLTWDESAAISRHARVMAAELPIARMRALYSDFVDERFVDPSEAITEEDVTFMIANVEADLADAGFVAGHTPDEIMAQLDEPELLEGLRSVYQNPRSVRD